jgi:DNA processing protein
VSALSARDREAAEILALLDAPGLGPKRVLDALARWGNAEAASSHLANDPRADSLRSHFASLDLGHYETIISKTRALGGDIKLWSDKSYPANLTKWAARPPVLFFKGNLDELTPRSLALVGRVDPTEAGIAAATRFARLCVENEINVISGLAKGIDGASHRGALLDPPGNTYAVIGHGLDFAYPSENSDLYAAIPEHGAIISQFATGVGPQRWTFPARNEAMCTLALGTVIIEAKEGCGSIIQADFSFKHGRPVFILSRNLKGDDAGWAYELVRRGAHVIERFEQVTEIVENTMGDLWDERPAQGTFFDIGPGGLILDDSDGDAMTEPRAALFDLDGVVVSTMTATRSALAELATTHLGRAVQPEAIPALESPYKVLKSLGVSSAWDVYKNEYDAVWEKHLPESVVYTEVVDLIERLVAEGWRVGAITGQNKARAERMLPSHVRGFFEVFYTATRDKAEGIRRALTSWSVPPTRAFYIGDQARDVDAARSAGVIGVAVLWGFSTSDELAVSRPDVVLAEPEDSSRLLELIG